MLSVAASKALNIKKHLILYFLICGKCFARINYPSIMNNRREINDEKSSCNYFAVILMFIHGIQRFIAIILR